MALTRFQIKVYAELGEKERINFVTTRKSRQFDLGGTIVAERFVNNEGVTSNSRITIKRTDQFNKDGSNRVVYRRVGFTRFVNIDEDRLAADLGYDIDQVIAYINQQANLEEDGFEFKFNGTHVGYADTVNFVGFSTASLSDGTVTVTESPVGVETAGGFIGSGVTCFNFIGSGVSFVTVPNAGITTVCLSGGGAGGIGTQFADEQKLSFGTDPTIPGNTNHQLQIWSSVYTNGGSGNTALGANIIKSASTARNLRVQTNASFVVEDTAGQNFIRATHPDWINVVTPDQIPGGKGSVELYYLNEGGDFQNLDGLRLYTTGVGVSIVGDLRVSGDLHVAGSGGGNPVTSGALTGAGNTTLTLTLNDASTVGIDVTNLRTITSIGSSTDYFYLNNGAQLSSNTHDSAAGVAFYNRKLQRGEELVFSTPGNSIHVGIWNAGVGIAGTYADVTTKGNWQIKWQYNHGATDWEASNTFNGPTGVEFNRDIVANNGTYAIRYDYDSEKLQLWQISTAFDWLLSSSAAGIGTTESYIYFASGDPQYGSQLPSVSEVRGSEWTQLSYRDGKDPFGPSIHTGVRDDDIWKSTRSLRPGLKLKTLLGSNTGLHHWGVGYGGTTGFGNGPLNPYNNATGSWRISTSNEIRVAQNSTINSNYTALDSGGVLTLDLVGRNISWRYNSDNSWDLFDEDTDEVILTGDSNLDGGDMYPYLFGAADTQQYTSNILQWEWDWNQKTWFIEHRDWSSGHNRDSALTIRNNAMPMKTAANSLESSNGYLVITSHNVHVTWGEKMRPGQELIFTMLSQTSSNSARHNFIIGVLESDYVSFEHGFRFDYNGAFKSQAQQDAGVTVQAGITTTCAGASMRLKYEHGTNKLKLDAVRSGVRETLAVSDTALDGNPIHISLGGNSTRLPTTTGVQVYGWEIAHEPPNYYNPWENWRIGGFPEDTNLPIGIQTGTSTTVLDWATDQVWRHKDGLAAGYKMHWISPVSQTNSQIGVFSSNNPTSGLTNLENDSDYWDWSWQTNTDEGIDELKGWTFNTSNSNYSGVSTSWTDPNPGSTRFSLRYHANNTMDLFDETNDEIIISKTAPNDGNPVHISWAAGGNTVSYDMMNDDFFGGGDVGIALTTATV